MLTVTDANFGDVLAAPMAIVDFWSPTCPYCMKLKPIFEEVSSQLGVTPLMAEAQVEDVPKSIQPFNVNGLPAVIFLKYGKEVHRVEGSMEKADFLSQIDKAFGSGTSAAAGSPSSSGGALVPSGGGGGVGLLSGLVLTGIVAGCAWLIFRD